MFSSNTSQVSNDAVYVEDVFSTYLYTGNSSSQTITNGIDLATYGGLVWTKGRSYAGGDHYWQDTARGTGKAIYSNTTSGQSNWGNALTSFNTDGFSIGSIYNMNNSGFTFGSWTFRKQPKFFDIVTWTGDGTSGKTISHSLGAAPGCIMVKRTDTAENWVVYHKYMFDSAGTYGSQGYINLNLTGSSNYVGTDLWSPTATTFKAFGTSVNINTAGATYVAYLFAHNAGGFGLTGTDNVISCGAFTNDSSLGATITLGYEPQWVMVKRTDSSAGSSGWIFLDNMRGFPVDENFGDKYLLANTTAAEAGQNIGYPTATGFTIQQSTWLSTGDYIYIAIRRGPMKVPTDATKMFVPIALTGDSASSRPVTTNFPVDMYVAYARLQAGPYGTAFADRLRQGNRVLNSSTTDAERVEDGIAFDSNTAIILKSPYTYGTWNFGTPATTYVEYAFRRAPSFFDEVCYTGDGTNGKAYNHNLTVVPELVIVKSRSDVANWKVLYQPAMRVLTLNTNAAYESAANTKYYFGNDTIDISPTATQFTVSNGGSLNVSGATYVALLFATCPGVSKVGTYTGTGAAQTINCGFTGGARFVMIKRTDALGYNWYVWDTARGMVAGSDYFLYLNNTNAEGNSNTVYTTSGGFQIVNTGAGLNASGGTYIYLAIA